MTPAALALVMQSLLAPGGVTPMGPELPPLHVGLFDAAGVSRLAFEATVDLLDDAPGVELHLLRPRDITKKGLRDVDVLVFTGGSGSRQGKALGDEGRARVREFVRRGGGYVGICAGAYLAMQGEEEFNKLSILAGHNLSGDFWKRGVAAVDVDAAGSRFQMHYANGPVFAREKVDGIGAYTALATFDADMYSSRHGTQSGEMPGTPAIVASRYGQGKLLLFSPNPVLGVKGIGHPAMFVDALEWSASGSDEKPTFESVFDGIWERATDVVWPYRDPQGKGD